MVMVERSMSMAVGQKQDVNLSQQTLYTPPSIPTYYNTITTSHTFASERQQSLFMTLQEVDCQENVHIILT